MKRGNSMTGDPSVIHMVCIKCGYVIPMDVDIAYEVMRTKMYKGKRVLYGYCMKCEHIMYPESILDNIIC